MRALRPPLQVSWLRLLPALVVPWALAAPSAHAAGSWAGMALEGASGGVRILRIADRGPAARAGLQPGDVITSFDAGRFTAPRDARSHILRLPVGSRHQVVYLRAGAPRTTTLILAKRPTPPGYVRLFLNHALLPDFRLPGVTDGRPLALSSLRGRVALVFFFASWCDACKSALPMLTRLHRAWAGRGVTVLGVGRDATAAPLAQLVRQRGLPFPVLHDLGNKVGRLNRLRVIPSLLFLDKQGVVRGYVQGAGYTYPQIERVVRRLLGRSRPFPSRPRHDQEVWA